MIREYTVNPPMPRIMVQPEELPILTNGFFSFVRSVRIFWMRPHVRTAIPKEKDNYPGGPQIKKSMIVTFQTGWRGLIFSTLIFRASPMITCLFGDFLSGINLGAPVGGEIFHEARPREERPYERRKRQLPERRCVSLEAAVGYLLLEGSFLS